MQDWVWMTIIAVLIFALVYTWARKGPVEAPQPKSEARRSGKKVEAKKETEKKEKAKTPAKEREKETKAEPSDAKPLPRMEFEEDQDVDPTRVGMQPGTKRRGLQPPAKKILFDADAEADEPTNPGALILLTGLAQTDRGLRRKRNEDAVLALPEDGIFVVADGMGGYKGGEIASSVAVKTIEKAFRERTFVGQPHEGIPVRASELARAIQMANEAILERAESEPELSGMGTTICAARFSPNKQRLYIGHVGDSRMYRWRDGNLKQLTADHTMKDLGVTGEAAAHLSRAVGIWPTVPVDVVLCKPRPADVYLVCSDGLTKMLTDAQIGAIIATRARPSELVDALILAANEKGGKDNISVIIIRVDPLVS